MVLLELFDRPAQYTIHKTSFGLEAFFAVGGLNYRVALVDSEPESEETRRFLHLKFGKIDPETYYERVITQYPILEVNFRIIKEEGTDFELSGTGNEVVVFSTVLAIMQEVDRKLHPIELQFSAKEPSRKRLYDRMVRVLAQKFGYRDVTQVGKFTRDKHYVLVKLPTE